MAAQVASVLGFAEEPVAERNPIAAAFGFPGAYWWEADYNLQQPHRYASFDAGSVSGTPERRPDARRYSSTAPAWFSATTPPKKKTFTVKPKTPPLTHLDFRPRRPLGKGKFGEVYLTTHQPSGRLYALKVLHKRLLYNSKLRERARNERRINGALGPHPFIVRMQYAFATERCLCLVLDLAPCGELFQLVKVAHPWKNGKTKPGKFPEQAARFYVAECLLALEFLHERRVLYRDLKPENVLIQRDGHVCISDFGLSKPGVNHPLRGARSMCGTPEYLAPEILRGTHEHGLAVDFWCLGALFYELLDGYPPWFTKDKKKLLERVARRDLELKLPRGLKPKLSKDGELCLRALLHRDATVRLGSDGDAQAVKDHPCFGMVDFDGLAMRHVDPPFLPTRFVADLRSDEEVLWSDVKVDADRKLQRMDISDERFDEIFAKFEYRGERDVLLEEA